MLPECIDKGAPSSLLFCVFLIYLSNSHLAFFPYLSFTHTTKQMVLKVVCVEVFFLVGYLKHFRELALSQVMKKGGNITAD